MLKVKSFSPSAFVVIARNTSSRITPPVLIAGPNANHGAKDKMRLAQVILLLSQTGVLAWTAFLILRYTKATEKYTEATTALLKEAKRQNKMSLRRIVLPQFTADRDHLKLFLQNVGAGCAVNVKIAPVVLGRQTIPNFADLGVIETRFSPVDYLPNGEPKEILPQNYADGVQQQAPALHDWWFHPAKAPAANIDFKISFEDIEGRKYEVRAKVRSDGTTPRRELRIGRIEEVQLEKVAAQ
jgi:hypothetical protein